MSDSSWVVRFVKYVHDSHTRSENLEVFADSIHNGSTNLPGEVSSEEALEAARKAFNGNPFDEVGIIAELNLDTGEVRILGVQE